MDNKKSIPKINSKIPVILFDEDDKVIAYSPVLDLSTYGKTEEQAHKRFTEAVLIFLKELIEMGTVEAVLTEYGWHKTPSNTWEPPSLRSCTEEMIKIPEGA